MSREGQTRKKKGEQIIREPNSSQCMSFTLTFIGRDGGEIGAKERGKKREKEEGSPKIEEAGGWRNAGGETWGFVFSIAGGRAEHVLISYNATHYVISHYALCQRFTSFSLFSALSLLSWPQPIHPQSRAKGWRVHGGVGVVWVRMCVLGWVGGTA